MNERKKKIKLLRGLLTGHATAKDLHLIVWHQYSVTAGNPGIYVDRQGHQWTAAQMQAQIKQAGHRAAIVWTEIKTYP